MTGVPAPLGPPAAPAASGLALTVDYPVFFVPECAAEELAAAKRNRTWRIVSLVISVLILAAIYWFLRDQLGPVTWPILVISLAFPLLMLVWAIVQEVQARRAVRTIRPGLALGVGREGLVLAEASLPWDAVEGLRAVTGRFGRGDRLEITGGGSVTALPLAYLSELPATVDGAIRALSGGRRRIDFSALDA